MQTAIASLVACQYTVALHEANINSVRRTGVTMQTSAKRAKFSSVYEWLQVGRLERSQVRRGDLSSWRSGTLSRLHSQPLRSKLNALEAEVSALPSNVNQPY